MASEFELIARYFTRPVRHSALGVGDDGAIIRPRPGMDIVVSTDMLVEGTHFLADTPAHRLGWKALAVNLSDLAAMGAEPRWALLAVSLPESDEPWIGSFCAGFFELADRFSVDLIGGDTTRGPRTITVTVLGESLTGRALTRAGGLDGDDVWVSGRPGRAALGLSHLQGRARLSRDVADRCIEALERPIPRVELGMQLAGIAHAAIDVSDGLLADLGHLLERSNVGAELWESALPFPLDDAREGPAELTRQCLLSGGDDYELLFAAPPGAREGIQRIGLALELPLARIGRLDGTHPGALSLLDAQGRERPLGPRGFDHFA